MTLCAPILLIIMSIASIFGMGGSSVIARMLGEGNTRSAKTCVTFCTYAMAAAGAVLLAGLPLMRSAAAAISFGFFCATVYYLVCMLRSAASSELFDLSSGNLRRVIL